MPTCQKSSLNSRMNLTRRENAGVFTLMGLTPRHHSNAIHELLRSQPAALSFQHITRSKTAVLDQISSSLSCTFTCSHPRIHQERGNISAFRQNPFRIFRICNNGRRNSLQRPFTAPSLLNLMSDWSWSTFVFLVNKRTQPFFPPPSCRPSWTMTIPFTLAICHPWSD